MVHTFKIIALTCLCGGTSIASAEVITGRVVGVTDGDTVTLLDAQNQQHKIRLAGIDAPQRNQPFGQKLSLLEGPGQKMLPEPARKTLRMVS